MDMDRQNSSRYFSDSPDHSESGKNFLFLIFFLEKIYDFHKNQFQKWGWAKIFENFCHYFFETKEKGNKKISG